MESSNRFQQPERVLGFFNAYRDGRRVTRRTLTEIADQFVYWVRNRSEKWGAPIVDAPEQERRDDFVLPYLQQAETDRVAVILKGRQPARILVAIGGKHNDSPHLGGQPGLGVSNTPAGNSLSRVDLGPHDTYTLAYLAGHSDFSTTKRYVHPQADTVRAAIERARGEKSGHSSGHSKDKPAQGPSSPACHIR